MPSCLFNWSVDPDEISVEIGLKIIDIYHFSRVFSPGKFHSILQIAWSSSSNGMRISEPSFMSLGLQCLHSAV